MAKVRSSRLRKDIGHLRALERHALCVHGWNFWWPSHRRLTNWNRHLWCLRLNRHLHLLELRWGHLAQSSELRSFLFFLVDYLKLKLWLESNVW